MRISRGTKVQKNGSQNELESGSKIRSYIMIITYYDYDYD